MKKFGWRKRTLSSQRVYSFQCLLCEALDDPVSVGHLSHGEEDPRQTQLGQCV